MRDLLNAIGFLGLRQASNLILSVLRAKVLAVLLGPAGVGLFSQAINLQGLLWSVSAAGTGRGVTVLVADYQAKNDFARLNRVLTTAMVFLVIVGGVFVVGCAFLADQISLWVFGAAVYGRFVLIVAAASWFAIQSSLVLALFRGLAKIREYAISFVIGYLLTIVGIATLTLLFGLTGAILSILVGQVINYLIGMMILKGYVLTQFLQIGFFRLKPSWDSIQQIMRFVGPLVIVAMIAGVSNLILRGQLICRLGEAANGYYQVVWGISLAYMALINDTNQSYVLPKIASHLENQNNVVQIQNNMLRIYLLLLSPLLIALFALREIWIPILYSREFLVASSLLLWQFVGDLLTTVRRIINVALIPRRRFAYLVFEESLSWGGWIGLSLWLMPRFQLVSVPMGYFFSSLVLIFISLTYQYLIMDFRIRKDNLWLLAKLLPLLLIGFAGARLIPSIGARLLFVAGVIGVMVFWLPSQTERQKAISWVGDLIAGDRKINPN